MWHSENYIKLTFVPPSRKCQVTGIAKKELLSAEGLGDICCDSLSCPLYDL